MKNCKVSLWKIFAIFSKIGAFTIGGGYAMIPVIQNEMCRRGWIGENDFTDIVVLAQSAPGLLAVNMAIFAGKHLRGVKGSVVAALGAILPSFIAILAIAMLFNAFNENVYVQRFFKGLRPVAVAMILVPMVKMVRKGNRNWWTWGIFISTIVLVALLKVSPIYILMTLITVTVAIVAFIEKKTRK